jgi:hypothetical protein
MQLEYYQKTPDSSAYPLALREHLARAKPQASAEQKAKLEQIAIEYKEQYRER